MGKVSAAKVRQTDTTNTVYVQMRNLCSGLWTTQGRSLDHYKEMIDDIVTERVNTGSASLNRQAAAVIEWFRSTRMSGSLIHFIDVDEGPVELQRRLGETDSDRFRPLFEARWSQAYPTLTKLFDKSTDGSMVALEMASVLIQIGMQSGGHPLTPSNIACFCDLAHAKLDLLKVPSIESETSANSANQKRITAFVKMVGPNLRAGQGSTANSTAVLDDQDCSAIMADPHFISLVRSLDGHQTVPINTNAVIEVMLKSLSPAGMLAFCGRKIDAQQFRMLRGISIDKTMIPLISLTKKLLNVDVNERERPEWSQPITEKFMRRFLAGEHYFMGLDQTHLRGIDPAILLYNNGCS